MEQHDSDQSPIVCYTGRARGAEWILFLHAAFADHNMFRTQIEYFQGKYCILTLDMIGHGRSKGENMELRFNATILQNGDMDAAYVEVPYDIRELFGKGRLLVNASFDGIPYRGQVVKMGTPCYIIGVTKQIRRQLGKSFGDTVEVVLRERESEEAPLWKCPKCGREFKKKGQGHYCGEKPKTIDEYILSQDEDKQEELQHIRRILREALPEAEERISWSMPTYWKGHNILHFAASKQHIGLYPGPAAVTQFAEELQGYKTDKGTIRIPYGKIEDALIGKIAKWCQETGNHA